MTTTGAPILLLEAGKKTASVPRAAAAVPAALFLAVLAVSLSRNLFDPPGFDQAYYLYVTERVMAGDVEHALFWSMNAMGAYVPHALSILLFGSEPWSLRVFDACWQAVTFAVLVGFLRHVSGRWMTAWAGAALYAAVYYGGGYIHTAQREGFAVLPLLLMAWAVHAAGPKALSGATADGGRHSRRRVLLLVPAGAAGLFALSLKPTLGLCYGVLWLLVLADGVAERRAGLRAVAPGIAFTGGFVATALAGGALLLQLGLWSSLSGSLTLGRQVPPAYVNGVTMMRQLTGYLAGGLCLAGLIGWRMAGSGSGGRGASAVCEAVHVAAGVMIVFGLLLLVHRWSEAQLPLISVAGLLLPAVGAILTAPWSGRSRGWRICLLLAAANFAAVCLQGWFFLYHMLPLLAFMACLAAVEIVDRLRDLPAAGPGGRAWTMACLAGLVYLSVGFWGHAVTRVTWQPWVLAGTDLVDHYTRVTRSKTRYPHYGTSIRVAGRIRALTDPHEPIALLFREPRIYHLAHRPPVHPLLVPNEWTSGIFEDFLGAVAQKRPRIVVARVPEPVRGLQDASAVQEALFADIEAIFGPRGRIIREGYRLSEVVDDVAILQPAPMCTR